MLTEREQELLRWIEENPLISQQELASYAGITRSSVAVHISNLMKKGFIQGKGYVLRKNPYAAIVGGANIDIIGNAECALDLQDSTPGNVEVLLGGVGRNQAHNLRLLGIDVKMITMFGEDMYGQKIKQSSRELGIDITESITLPGSATSTYVSVKDTNGKLYAGIADMKIYENLTKEVLALKMPMLNQATVCVSDTNIPEESLCYLADNIQIPLFVETISSAKVLKIANMLNKIHTLKTDSAEIQHLLGYQLSDRQVTQKAIDTLLDSGVKNIFMNYSATTVVCANAEKTMYLDYHIDGMENKNGARDSFMAALVWAYINECDFEQAARAGVAAASICALSKHVVNERLNIEYMVAVMNGKRELEANDPLNKKDSKGAYVC